MLQKSELKQDVIIYGETALAVISIPAIFGANIVAQILAFYLATQKNLFPGVDAFMSIVSTCSEIIAGLYGTTLAGYTFFLSRIDALITSDTTLDYVVQNIKKRFRYLIWYITFNVLITLFISIILMYVSGQTAERIGYMYRLFCNEFMLFLGFSVVLILYYAILVINPNCVEKEAARLKKRLSHHGPAGSVTEFIALYRKIEIICKDMIPGDVLDQIRCDKGERFSYTIELLSEQEIFEAALIRDLNRIRKYYECTINCMPLYVNEKCAFLQDGY